MTWEAFRAALLQCLLFSGSLINSLQAMPFPFLTLWQFSTGVLGVLWWLGGWVVGWLGGWHSVPERAYWGTEYACRAQKGFLRYATHHQRHSVRKTGFSGTDGIFGTGNPLLRYGMKRPDAAGSKKCPSSREAVTNHFRRYCQPFLYICV